MGVLDKQKILLTDDETLIRDLLAEELQLEGATIVPAKNGREAFDLLLQNPDIHIVITDVKMPGGDGVELLRRIRERDRTMPPVILITGYADISVDEAHHFGAVRVIEKPFKVEELLRETKFFLQPQSERLKTQPDDTDPNRLKLTRTLKFGTDLVCGHTGFFVRDFDATPGSMIDFTLNFSGAPITSLRGSGYCRWVRRKESPELARGAGIEIRYLVAEDLGEWLKFQAANRSGLATIPMSLT